jgi:hypothetical protein
MIENRTGHDDFVRLRARQKRFGARLYGVSGTDGAGG